jgi:WD40 repeat protein
VLDAATGERVLTAAMAGREELFFNPDRNKFLEGHISEIATVQFLPPDGDLLLSADYFGSISVWDSAPGPDGVGYERSRLLSEYSFSEFAVSDDGSLVLAGGAATSDPTGRLQKADLKHMGVIWRTEDIRRSPGPSRYRTLENEHPDFAITAVALSPSSHRAVTAGRRGRIVVWDVATGKPLASVAESHNRDQVSGIFFETEEQLVSVGYDGRILRWTINGTALESTEIARAAGQSLPEFIVRLRPTRDRSRFVTSEVLVRKGEAGRQINELNIMIWSGNGARPLVDPPIPIPERDKEKAFRHDLSWSADGRELMLILDGVITVFETEGWTVTRKFRQDEENVRPVRGALAPTVEGTSTRAATFDGRFTHLWDLETGEHLAEFRSHAQYNVHAAFSPDNKYVATASETLRLFNADETSPDHGLTVYRLPNRTVHQSPVADVAFQPGVEGYRLASVDTQGRLELWTWTPGVADDSPLNSIFEAVTNETMSPSWAQDLLFGNTLAFDGDGRFLAALQRGSLAVWDMKGAQPVALNVPLPEDRKVRFNQLAFSRDGLLAAGGVSSDNETEALSSFAAIWRVASDGSLRLVGTIEGEHSIDTIAAGTSQTGILALAFDPVRGSIVTGGADNRLIRWQVRAMDQDRPVPLERIADVLRDGEEPHRDPVVAVEITADGHMVSADAAGYFVLWPRPEAAATP